MIVLVPPGTVESGTVAVTWVTCGGKKYEGTSKGEIADRNDVLTFEVKPEAECVVAAGGVEKTVKAGKAGEQTVVEIVTK